MVIVNWNLKDSLRETLVSFRQVNYPGLQIVVSDNGSTDGSIEMVRSEFPEVHLLTREKGVGYAKGASLGMAFLADKTKYIFSTTNDVLVDPEMITALVDYAEAHPDAGVLLLGRAQRLPGSSVPGGVDATCTRAGRHHRSAAGAGASPVPPHTGALPVRPYTAGEAQPFVSGQL